MSLLLKCPAGPCLYRLSTTLGWSDNADSVMDVTWMLLSVRIKMRALWDKDGRAVMECLLVICIDIGMSYPKLMLVHIASRHFPHCVQSSGYSQQEKLIRGREGG